MATARSVSLLTDVIWQQIRVQGPTIFVLLGQYERYVGG